MAKWIFKIGNREISGYIDEEDAIGYYDNKGKIDPLPQGIDEGCVNQIKNTIIDYLEERRK